MINATGIIILAAGASSRLGKPKQLLVWKEKPLIEHTVDEAEKALLFPIIVVTGAKSKSVSNILRDKSVTIVNNADWQQGMALGIVKGVQAALSKQEGLKNIITAVCDQPFVSAGLFRQLLSVQTKTGKGIVASHYGGISGTPVLFTQKYFPHLQNLHGNEGARKLLKFYDNDVATVPFPEGAVDIDTEEDYQKLLGGHS